MALAPYFRILRPKQWTKNLLVFAALLFTARFGQPSAVTSTLLAALAMCLLSSAVYIWNDILDADRDRGHPHRKSRPIAAGQVSVPTASILAVLLLGGGVTMMYGLGRGPLWIASAYLLLQFLYNAGGRSLAITDVFLIASGFVLRAMLGAAAISASISGWLIFCTGCLALMIGFAKRRSEFVLMGDAKADSRTSLSEYSLKALDSLVLLFASGAALTYGVYSIESDTARRYPALILSAVFVVYGVSRYLVLVFGRDEGGEPEVLLFRDPHMLASVLLFVASAGLAMSGVRLPLLET